MDELGTEKARVSAGERILGNLIRLSLGTLISRGLGFIREMLTASVYDASGLMDSFVVAFKIPTLFRRILAEDVVERAFMPPFKALMSKGEDRRAWFLAWSCLNIMVLALVTICFGCYLFAPQLVSMLGPGLDLDQQRAALTSTYIVLPFMVLIGLAAYVGGILTFFEKNVPYSLAPLFLSLGVMVCVPLFSGSMGIHALSVGFLAGGACQFLFQIPFVYGCRKGAPEGSGYTWRFLLPSGEGALIWGQAMYVAIQSILLKSVEIVETRLASRLVVGSISSLWYAHRLIQLPFAIFGLAVGRAVAPYLTEQAALRHPDSFKKGVLSGYRLNLLVFVPSSCFLFLCSQDVVGLVYQRGAFSQKSVELTASAFACYTMGLTGMGLVSLFTRVLSTVQWNRGPLVCSMVAAVLNLGLDYLLVQTRLEHAGLALAASIAFTANSLLLVFGIHGWLKKEGAGFSWSDLLFPLLKMGLCALGALLLGVAAERFCPLSPADFLGRTLRIFLIGGGVVAGSFAVLWLCPMEETRWIGKKLWSR